MCEVGKVDKNGQVMFIKLQMKISHFKGLRSSSFKTKKLQIFF